MKRKQGILVVIGFAVSVLLAVSGTAVLLMRLSGTSDTQKQENSADKVKENITPTTSTMTPTQALDLSEDSDNAQAEDGTDQQQDGNLQTEASEDTNFIFGRQTITLDGKEYKISEDSHSIVYEEEGETKQLYTTDGLLKKFNIVGGYIYVIERHSTEANHYYFKRILIGSGKATVLWHYISGYTMEDFLISPTTFATNKLYYILFTATKQILVLKIKDYKLVAQKSQNIEYTTIEKWYKLKDQDAVTIVFKQNDQTQTLQINFE